MPTDPHQDLIQRLAQEAREGGLIVRCEHGVLAILHPRNAKPEQTAMPLETEAPAGGD